MRRVLQRWRGSDTRQEYERVVELTRKRIKPDHYFGELRINLTGGSKSSVR